MKWRGSRSGLTIIGGTQVTGLSQQADGVQVHARGADGAAATFRASYLVGAAGMPALLAGWLGRVRLEVPGPLPARMILVRPDGYIAWATDEQDPARRDAALGQALTQWCGAPAGQTAAYGRS